MAAPKGNRNRAMAVVDKRDRTNIMLNADERTFFASLDDKARVASGIHRAYEILREDKTLAAAADISALPRTLVAFAADGAQTLLVAREGLQFAVLRGEVVIVCVWSLESPIRAGWCALNYPERVSRSQNAYTMFVDAQAIAPSSRAV